MFAILGGNAAILAAGTKRSATRSVRCSPPPTCSLAIADHAKGNDTTGALWPIGDTDTAELANTYYTTITDIGVEHSAAALHHATRELRRRNRAHPSQWAPYTHTGP